MNCAHCQLFFLELHRRCTINLNGECDCPICQGVCDCKDPARMAMPRQGWEQQPPVLSHTSLVDAVMSGARQVYASLPTPDQDGDITVHPDLNARRKFGQPKKS